MTPFPMAMPMRLMRIWSGALEDAVKIGCGTGQGRAGADMSALFD